MNKNLTVIIGLIRPIYRSTSEPFVNLLRGEILTEIQPENQDFCLLALLLERLVKLPEALVINLPNFN